MRKKTNWLQLFADTEPGEETPLPDAGEAAAAPETADFETLIRGQYKKEFDARVQGILKERLKKLKEGEARLAALEPLAQTLSQRYGTQDPAELAKALDRDPRGDPKAAFRLLKQQAEEVKADYPDFDLARELENPAFARLAAAGVDARTAYETAHREELLRSSMAFGAAMGARQAVAAIQARAARPGENGAAAGAPAAVPVSDPRNLTPEMRRSLRERVRRGEKIIW